MDKWKIERIDRTRWLVELYFNNIPKMPQTITLAKVYNRKPTEEEIECAYTEWYKGFTMEK